MLLCFVATLSWAQEPVLKHNADGRLASSRHDIYDSHDRLKVQIEYTYNDSTGAVETRTLTGYDKKGRKSRTEIYSADDLLLFSDTFHYSRDGRLRYRIQKSYDENGVLIEKLKIKN